MQRKFLAEVTRRRCMKLGFISLAAPFIPEQSQLSTVDAILGVKSGTSSLGEFERRITEACETGRKIRIALIGYPSCGAHSLGKWAEKKICATQRLVFCNDLLFENLPSNLEERARAQRDMISHALEKVVREDASAVFTFRRPESQNASWIADSLAQAGFEFYFVLPHRLSDAAAAWMIHFETGIRMTQRAPQKLRLPTDSVEITDRALEIFAAIDKGISAFQRAIPRHSSLRTFSQVEVEQWVELRGDGVFWQEIGFAERPIHALRNKDKVLAWMKEHLTS